jgi:hypothetical protein
MTFPTLPVKICIASEVALCSDLVLVPIYTPPVSMQISRRAEAPNQHPSSAQLHFTANWRRVPRIMQVVICTWASYDLPVRFLSVRKCKITNGLRAGLSS